MNSISLKAVKKQFATFAAHYRALVIAAICAAGIFSIQLIYWKYVSGHWLVYSYEGQHLYFRSPNFMNYTFSYRSGWLVYSPMMILAFIGIIPFLWRGNNKVSVVAFFLLNYYIVCSWNIWWYGGRAMVQSYPVLCFCLAALADAAFSRKMLVWLLAPVSLVFIYYNAWITYIYHKGDLYDNDCMSEAYFWRIVGRWSAPANIAVLKDNPDLFQGKPKDELIIYQNNFGGKPLLLNKDNQNSPYYNFAFNGNNLQWLRAQVTFHCDEKEYEGWKMAQFVVRLVKRDSIVKERVIRVYRLLEPNQTSTIPLDMKLPHTAYDSVSVLFWNGGSDKPLWISGLEVKAFNE